MTRAAILIGVNKTGDLPRLRDAAASARLMEGWARAQGIEPHLFTDDNNTPVTVQDIRRTIRGLVDAGTVSQLLVYFSGHGVNLQRQEYWLLTDAPDDTQAAVNVASSAALASTCGIPHVVLISDACRTAPDGIRAQSIRGSEIFPNREEDPRPVDQFFACQLGKPSHEIRDPAVTTAEFRAIYTRELVPALLGEHAGIVEWKNSGAERVGHVHLRPLRDYLSAAVAQKLVNLQMQTKVIQVPVATISSDPPAWISQLAGAAGPEQPPPSPSGMSPEAVTSQILREAITGKGIVDLAREHPVYFGRAAGIMAEGIAAEARHVAEPFGPMHHETRCGFKLRGARAVEVVSLAAAELAFGNGGPGDDVRVEPSLPASNVLLVLESGSGVLLPAIPGFMCALTFDEDELIDVAYEPSEYTDRWSEYQARAAEIRALRGIASSATSRGSFKLDRDDALAVAQQMQILKGVDPSLALYAAYAYHDLQRRDLLTQMQSFMIGDLGAVMFDLALLARVLDKRRIGRDTPPLIGAVPLLAQGWVLMRAFEVTLSDRMAQLEAHRRPSLWTKFSPEGVGIIRAAIADGELA